MKNRSLLNLPCITPKLPPCQKDLTNSNTKVGIINITKYKENIIKNLQYQKKFISHWYTANRADESCLSTLLGILQTIYEQVMFNIKLFVLFKDDITPKKSN